MEVFELQDLKDVSVLIKLTGSLRDFLLNSIAYWDMYKGCILQASGVSWYSLLYNLTWLLNVHMNTSLKTFFYYTSFIFM